MTSHNKKLLIISCLSFATVFAACFNIGMFVDNSSGSVIGGEHNESCKWNHYSEVSPTFLDEGIREYWVCCTHHDHIFIKPTVGQISEAGIPTKLGFIENDNRILPEYVKCVDFENVSSPFSVVDSTLNGTELSKNKNYKIIDIEFGKFGVNNTNGFRAKFTSGTDSGIAFKRNYVDTIFADSSIKAIEFDFKADANATNCRHRTAGSNITYFCGTNGSGFTTQWQRASYTREMYEADKASTQKDFLFMWGTTAGEGYVYFDNFRPVTQNRKFDLADNRSKISFDEMCSTTNVSSNDVFVGNPYHVGKADNSNFKGSIKLNTNDASGITECNLSTEYKTEGLSSLHIHKNSNHQIAFYFDKDIAYASESHGGIKFDIMTSVGIGSGNFLFFKDKGSSSIAGPCNLSANKWSSIIVLYNNIRDTGNNYHGLFTISNGADGGKEMDIYVDNIRFADADDANVLNNFEDTGVFKIENTQIPGEYYYETGANYYSKDSTYPVSQINLRDTNLSNFWLNGTTAVSSVYTDNKHTTSGGRALKINVTNDTKATYFFFNKKINDSMSKGDMIEFDIYSECNNAFTFGKCATAGRSGGYTVEPNKWTTISLTKGNLINGKDQFFRLHEGPLAVGSIWIDNIRFVKGENTKFISFEDGKAKYSSGLAEYYHENSSTPIVKASGNCITAVSLSKEVDFGTGQTLKITKTNAWSAFFLGSDFYSKIGTNDEFSFDLYSTVAINSTSGAGNFLDGNNKIIGDGKYCHPANQVVHYTFNKSNLTSDGRFLVVQGSSAGDFYFDNFKIIHEENKCVNSGTFYNSVNEGFALNIGRTLPENTTLYLDGDVFQKYNYSLSENKINIKSKALANGEHCLSYNLFNDKYEMKKESFYFGVYEATSSTSKNLTLTYGSQNYQTISGFSGANRVVYNGKSIAFEKSGSNILIPDAAIVECLNSVNGAKTSGSVKFSILCGDYNVTCKELNFNVTLSGSSDELYRRSYVSDEYYHSFGYSSTAGGTNDQSLMDDDYFMEYERSGLDCVYEQIGGISADTATESSFEFGGVNYRMGQDLEKCDRLGQECYLIDYFMRNIIKYDQVAVYQKPSFLGEYQFKGYVTYANTIDTDKETAFKNYAKTQLGLSNTNYMKWERYQKPAYGEDGYYADFETFVTKIVERLNVYAVKHPSLKKIVICDEPRYYNLECVGQIYKATVEALKRVNRTDIEVDANLLPLSAGWGYNDGDGLGPKVSAPKQDGKNFPERVATYNAYLTKFIAETGANYISYDIYPLWDGVVDAAGYSNLIVAAKFAKANNLNLNVVTETYTAVTRNSSTNRRVMSRDDMHWLCNMLMGFGVDRVSFFTYYNRAGSSSEFRYDPNDKNATVGCMKIERFDENGNFMYAEKTPVWYNVQTMLYEMNEFSDVALSFNYVSCQFIKGSFIPSDHVQSDAAIWAQQVDDSSLGGSLSSISVDREYTLASSLKDKDENYMYMLQNTCDPKYESFQTLTLTFTGKSYVVIYENGTPRVVKLIDNKLTLQLSSGNAAYVMPY